MCVDQHPDLVREFVSEIQVILPNMYLIIELCVLDVKFADKNYKKKNTFIQKVSDQ